MLSNIPGQTASAAGTGAPGPYPVRTAHTHETATPAPAPAPTPAGTPSTVPQPGQPSVPSQLHRKTASPVQGFRPPPDQTAAASPVPQAAHISNAIGTPRAAGAAHSMFPALQHGRQGSVPSALPRNSEQPGPIAGDSPAQRPQSLPRDVRQPPQASVPNMPQHARQPDPNLSRQIGFVNPGRQVPRPAPPLEDPRGGISIPSPGPNPAAKSPKFQDDYVRIFYSIQQSLPGSARAAVRENWEKCLLGSAFQQEFVLTAMVRNVEHSVVRRTMKGFGYNLTSVAQKELVAHMTTADIDLVAEAILSKASDKFLDAALEKRLPTIDAKPLINALARAARLGYEPDDIEDDAVEENGAPLAAAAAVPLSMPVTSAPAAVTNVKIQCKECNRMFNTANSYNYHTAHLLCRQMAPSPYGFKYACPDCGQGFSDAEATNHHLQLKACTILGSQKTPSEMATQPTATATATPAHPIATSARQPYVAAAQPHASNQRGFDYASAVTRSANAAEAKAANPGVREHEYRRAQEPSAPVYTAVGQQTPVKSPRPLSWQASTQTPPSAIGQKVPTNAYGHLTEEQMKALNYELLGLEEAFALRFQEAGLVEDPAERTHKLEGLRNLFCTRQSNIRRKYGVRLRVRRTKADILAEKQRMGLATHGAHEDVVHATKRARPGSSSQTDSRGYLSDSPEAGGSSARRRRLQIESTPPAILYSTGVGASVAATGTASGVSGAGAASAGKNSTMVAEDTNMSDSSEDDDDDIPARLPDDIRQSFYNR